MNKMIADTNVILRILVKEDSKQSKIMRGVLEKMDIGELGLIVPNEVILETVWVMESFYSIERKLISDYLTHLLDSYGVESDKRMQQALARYGSTKFDIVDLYLSVYSVGIDTCIMSWDKDFRKMECEWYTPDQIT